MNIIIAHDLVEPNGKTIKENNMMEKHTIEIGSLVEIISEDYDDDEEPMNGIRMYVVNHSRDCDGTPLYDLSSKLNIYKEYKELEHQRKNAKGMELGLINMSYWLSQGAISRHYGKESIKMIRPPK